ncbi:unnamed protein product [Lymnaea stagnalis]|uniref:Uncharacterized protein n=1 Tax=Lymnaea stagnalis TaxID=6523 RepID=A0AAV2H0T6_LYMST
MSSNARFRNKLIKNRNFKRCETSLESSPGTPSIGDHRSGECSTPYRLPRIHLENEERREVEVRDRNVEKVYGRFGYELVMRLPEVLPLSPGEFISPQRLLSQRYRQVGLVPRIREENIAASYRHTPSINVATDNFSRHDDLDDSDVSSSRICLPFCPTGMTRSSTRSIDWALGHSKNSVFDAAGKSHIQGPFSRGFKVRCKAPRIWMSMKWGRSRTMVR